jgi:hypothetical protein
MYKGSVYKAEQEQLQLPVRTAAGAATELVGALLDLVPPPAEAPVEAPAAAGA